MDIRFTLDANVFDPRQLHRAAAESYRRDNFPGQVTADDVRDLFGPEDDPRLSACILQLLDPGSLPGCSIYQSQCE